ncbi:MAG TPA: NAD(P)/FAD-dependent oxidoreductase [Aggregatilinea sp.]|uniref:flavin-containing monooxygenase n=1 Tax=Aggregatilinea sp. TaxID=2806333 RepID=UPI002B6EEE1D|nr:NAD(P)/FAD-dependent oxidoreductase [Aggregatilinea sp.]HML22351.1 NAD(P)/FAD-dependent oxidoreductase [Aggregatilinea sp.]
MAEDVLVIGAGPGGLASAYFLEQAGISYRVIDRADVIASTWNGLYPSLRLNTTRFYSHLPGQRFPLSFGLFPTGREFHTYLERYARSNGFNIHLGVEVIRVCPEEDGWRVITNQGPAWYRAVISATGRFCKPCAPTFPGEDDFRGQILHACDYVGPEPFAGKRVMVVGNGPSGVDIAAELGRHALRPVLLSQRTGVYLRPRYPLGLPMHIWMMIADILPDRLGQSLLDRVSAVKFENLDEIGLKVPKTPEDTSAAGSTRGYALIEAVKAGRVKSVDAPQHFEPDAVVLTDGSRQEVDAVIMATGYQPALFNYMDLDVDCNRDGWPVRVNEHLDDVTSGRREVKDYPGLYLVGTFYQGKGALHNMGIEAQQAVHEIKQRLAATQPEAAGER